MSQDNKPSSDTRSSSSALAPVDRHALVPSNPTVIQLSKAFRWKPQTAIARIERALPDKFEQQIYLAVATGLRIHPESLAKLLLVWRGSKPLNITDLERRQVGHNAISNSFGEFTDFLEACMRLVKIVSQDYQAFNISMTTVAHLVMAYGPNNPEQVIEMIDTNLDDCCEFFGISHDHSWSTRLRSCVWLFVERILPELQRRGVPNPLDTDMFIGDPELQRYCMGEEFVIDPYEDSTTLRLVQEMIGEGGIMSIEALMRGEIARAFGQRSWEGQQNPLVTVGLSHEVLSLGIPDEQLFTIVQRHIRQLIAAKHPDHLFNVETPEFVAERQRILDALEILDDQETFSKALAEFRAIKSQDRADIAEARASLKTAKVEIERLNSLLTELGTTKNELERERKTLDLRKVEEESIIPDLNERMLGAEGRREKWYNLFMERRKKTRELSSFIYWLQGYLIAQSIHFKSTGVRPTLFSEAHSVYLLEFTLFGNWNKKPIVDQIIGTVPEEIRLEYSEMASSLRERLAVLGKKANVACSFKVLPIKNGITKNEFEINERVIGSMRSQDAAARTKLTTSQLPDLFVLRNLSPFLIPGSHLVSVCPRPSIEKKNFDDIEMLHNRPIVKGMPPLFRTNRIILRVV